MKDEAVSCGRYRNPHYDKEQPDEMPTLLEAGTLNMPGIAGLRPEWEYILEKGTDVIWQQADAYASFS